MNWIPSIPNNYPKAGIFYGTISKDFQITKDFGFSLQHIGSYLSDHLQFWTVTFNISSNSISPIR